MSNEPTETPYQPGQTNVPAQKPSLPGIVRAFGMVLGPSLVLDLFTAGSTLAVVSGWLFWPRRG